MFLSAVSPQNVCTALRPSLPSVVCPVLDFSDKVLEGLRSPWQCSMTTWEMTALIVLLGGCALIITALYAGSAHMAFCL